MNDWERLAVNVLAGCMKEDRKQSEKILYSGNGVNIHDMPTTGLYRDIFLALAEVMANQTLSPTPTTIYNKGNFAPSDIDIIREIAETSVTPLESQDSASLIREESMKHTALDVLRMTAQKIKDGGDIRQIQADVIDRLSQIGGAPQKDTFARSIIEEIENQEYIVYPPISTGLSFIDKSSNGGIRVGRQWAIGGGEKSRKTTLVRNILLKILTKASVSEIGDSKGFVANDDITVCFLAFENDRYISIMDFAAMLASKYMLYKFTNDINKMYKGRRYHEHVNAEDMMEVVAQDGYGNYPEAVAKSIHFGIEQAKTLNLNIYDMTEEGGDLSTLADIKRVVNTHHSVHKKPHQQMITVLDYLGLVEVLKARSEQDEQKAVVRYMNKACTVKKMAVITLAQFNRTSNKERANDEEKDVMGTHGSSELERAVTNYFDVLSLDQGASVLVRSRRSRRGKQGTNVKTKYAVHPGSGTIVPNNIKFTVTD